MGDIRNPDRRGCIVWPFWALLFGLTTAGWARLWVSIQDWYWLGQAGVIPGPGYLAVSGGLWGLAGLAGILWLWQRRPGYAKAGYGLILFFAASYWLDRLIFSRSDGAWVNWPFSAAVTILGLVYAFWVLRPFSIRFSKRGDDGGI